ncbi:MAG: sulfate/molybdate ABC transporter ATP-binding protein [Phycisphaeraceae bacterium]|nr:sulfate/molybdate ABC transporter ATP-binding protein [Phycisphaeraceae bacterium]
MSIQIRNVTKTFGSFRALDDVSADIPTGELVALLGPSGSGKTTLLRLIAGLEDLDPGRGSIRYYEEDITGTPVRRRRVGFVFQHYALFRHMSVFENIAFGLKVLPRGKRPEKAKIRERVHELLRLVQLDGLAGRFPAQLSGGQRQRVALARALAVEPRVLLLDEPFGALDAKVRAELRQWIRQLHEELHITSVFVTHDQDEALEIADRVVVMSRGRIEQIGTPAEVYHTPRTEFVMNFLGQVNTFHGRAIGRQVEFADIRVASADDRQREGEVQVFVRPHEFELSDVANGKPSMTATVLRIHAAGSVARLDLQLSDGKLITAEVPQDRFAALRASHGDRVYVTPRRVHVF